jgi:two-component system sensor histidine kinase/response regulator
LPSAGSSAGPRILLVDDDLINQKVMVNLIKRRGWGAASAMNGRQCLDLLARERFDLVLLDIQMPELNGFETAALVRQQEAQRAQSPDVSAASLPARVPIVALTTVSEPGTRDRCLSAGMDDHLTKPVNTQALYGMVQKVLGLPG